MTASFKRRRATTGGWRDARAPGLVRRTSLTIAPAGGPFFARLTPTDVRHGFPMGRLGTAEEGCGCDRVHRLAARLLDQWPQHSGGRPGAAARTADERMTAWAPSRRRRASVTFPQPLDGTTLTKSQ